MDSIYMYFSKKENLHRDTATKLGRKRCCNMLPNMRSKAVWPSSSAGVWLAPSLMLRSSRYHKLTWKLKYMMLMLQKSPYHNITDTVCMIHYDTVLLHSADGITREPISCHWDFLVNSTDMTSSGILCWCSAHTGLALAAGNWWPTNPHWRLKDWWVVLDF